MSGKGNGVPAWALWVLTGAVAAAVLGWYARDRRDMQPVRLAPAEPAVRQQQAALNVNAATAEELEDLPGVGPVLAQRILDWREEHGPFDGPEALEQVPGVGPALCQAIAPYVRYSEERTP